MIYSPSTTGIRLARRVFLGYCLPRHEFHTECFSPKIKEEKSKSYRRLEKVSLLSDAPGNPRNHVFHA